MLTNHAQKIKDIHFKNKRIAAARSTSDAKAVTAKPKAKPGSVADLKAQAKAAGIKGYSSMNKADLIAAIKPEQ